MYTPRAGINSSAGARFRVGTVCLDPTPRPLTTSPSQSVGMLQQARGESTPYPPGSAREFRCCSRCGRGRTSSARSPSRTPACVPVPGDSWTLPACAVPEAEIIADQDRARAQPLHQQLRTNSSGESLRHFRRERQNQHLLDAFLLHQFGAAVGRRHQFRRAIRRHHARRMRIERQTPRLPAVLAGQFLDAPQNAPVAVVHAVEIADGQGGGPETRPEPRQAAINPHATNSRPPPGFPARRTPAGYAAAAGFRRVRAPGRGRCA